ncbi:endonuclease [Kitasatospora albolonga]|uniref:Endonuclease n=1 Tax=Kitasatospora albolonga TaxID=68173 RepID=A0ABC8BZS4_9ACTN|nr:endonuclease [Kitasatospora albolonga]
MKLGIGIGWRPEIAAEVEALKGIDWVEAVAENLCADHLPDSLVRLRERGVTVVPHGVSLDLGGADRPDAERLAGLAARAELLGTPLVTEHIAFVRAGGPLTASPRLEAGHLLPVPRTWDALAVLCENVRIAQDALPVPLALENIAALISWPDEELTEGQFLAELVERTGVRLLIDVANLHTNHVNRGEDPAKALDELPVEAIAYVHVAGGIEKNGVWHDTHAHPVTAPVLGVLAELRSRVDPPGVLLERDDAFPPGAELAAELETIRATLRAAGPAAEARTVRSTGTEARTTGAGARVACTTATGAGARTGRTAEPDARAARTTATEARTAGAGARTGRTAEPDARAARTTATEARTAGAGARTARTAEPDAHAARTAPAEAAKAAPPAETPVAPPGARDRTAVAQTALLSALVAGTPAPERFDHRRLRVQSRALAAKRAGVVAKVAPELPEILGDGYRAAFLAYARSRPMSGGYRRDALDFAEHVLISGGLPDPVAQRRLTHWWEDRSGIRPPRRTTRLVRAARAVLVGK